MAAYYNEIDPRACEWIRQCMADGLIADGVVDERSIADVQPGDLAGFRQCHFFSGIAAWSAAFRLAGIPDDAECWSGSAPCQPFSAAGKRQGEKDERHLWPELLRLIKACKPPLVFGEQVASSEVVGSQLEADFALAVRRGDFARANKLANRLVKSSSLHYFARWIDGVRADLEGAGYAAGFRVYGAHSLRAPHIRQRLYWGAVRVADAKDPNWRRAGDEGDSRRRVEEAGRSGCQPDAGRDDGGRDSDYGCCASCGKHNSRCRCTDEQIDAADDGGGVGDMLQPRLQEHAERCDNRHQPGRIGALAVGCAADASPQPRPNPWSLSIWHQCSDGRKRRVPARPQPGLLAVADDGIADGAALAGGGEEGARGVQAGWQSPTVEDAGRNGSLKDYEAYTENGQTSGCRLRAQAHSVQGAAGWATPRQTDPKCGHTYTRAMTGKDLAKDATTAGWPTPQALSFDQSHQPGNNRGANLTGELCGWGTPTSQDAKHTGISESEKDRDPRNLRIQAHGAGDLCGWPTPTRQDSVSARNSSAVRYTDAPFSKGDTLVDAADKVCGWNTPRATDGTNDGPGQTGGALPADAGVCGWPIPKVPGGDESSRSGDRKDEPLIGGPARDIGPAPLEADPDLWPLAPPEPGRVMLLRGAGNCIVPQLAAVFIEEFMGAINEP